MLLTRHVVVTRHVVDTRHVVVKVVWVQLLELIEKRTMLPVQDAHPMVVLRILPMQQVGSTQDLVMQLHWHVLHCLCDHVIDRYSPPP